MTIQPGAMICRSDSPGDSPARITFKRAIQLSIHMNYEKRFLHQIEELSLVFSLVNKLFKAAKPVDRELTKIFRKNKKYGSRDRRFISNSIFGYYRWLGWLRQLDEKKMETRLALGYLLDLNEINELIIYWAERCGFDNSIVQSFKNLDQNSIRAKSEIMSSFIQKADISALNPNLFTKELSEQTLEYFQQRPGLWIRFISSTCQSFLEFLESRGVEYRWFEQGGQALEILSPVNLSESLDFRAGRLEVQDISSQWVGKICQPKSGEKWWDVCAGSGGKALHLSALMQGKGTIYATEIESRYFKELKRRKARNKLYQNIKPILWDGLSRPGFVKSLDGALIDAPCSCSGTWRRSPDLRWNISKDRVREFAETQYRILTHVAGLLPQKTVLIYATCSIFPEENEQVIERFIKNHGGYSVCDINIGHPLKMCSAGVYLLPPQFNGNGLFISRLRRV